MIRISQTHFFLKEYVHIHQMGSPFVGGYCLHFSPTEQETSQIPILQAFGPQKQRRQDILRFSTDAQKLILGSIGTPPWPLKC